MFTASEQKLEQLFSHHGSILQRQQVLKAGLHPRLLSKWVEEGRIERLGPGLYRSNDALPISHESLLELALRIPNGVVCLTSALDFHELGTASPAKVQLAIPNKAYRPYVKHPPVRFYYFSERPYHYGIETYGVGTGEIKVYSQEKTLADLLYYRNKLGKTVFIEGLSAYLETPNKSIPKLIEAAKLRRVEKLMQPYLEALT